MQMCLSAKHDRPYVKPETMDQLTLEYKICSAANVKEMQLYGARNLLGLPQGIPDLRMMTDPIWSTWAQYKTNINESVVLQFAGDIRC